MEIIRATDDSFKKAKVWGMVLSSTLGMFEFGYMMNVLNTLFGFLYGNVYGHEGFANSAVTIGAAIGALVAGPIAKKFGRRKSMIGIDLIVLFASALTLVPNINALIIGRIVGGVCVGFNSTLVPLYMNEITPLPIKGVAGAFNQIQICLGAFLAILFGFGVPDEKNGRLGDKWWIVMLGFPILIASIRLALISCVYTKETPKFLVYSREREKAEQALKLIYKEDFVEEQLQVLEKARDEEEKAGKVTFLEILGPRFRRRLLIACFIAFLQQMTGVNAFMFYSTDIFKKALSGDGDTSEGSR